MGRSLADSRRWMQQGAALVADAIDGWDEADFGVGTELPGWTRKHLVAHLAANADAIGNLVHWAATGEPTPMYASPEQRTADIDAGARRSAGDLIDHFVSSAARLDAAMAALTEEQWSAPIVTAQGRTVPASETPWMRSREVMVHAVDLGYGIGFPDLPADFLAALCDDIVGKRGAAAGTATAGPALTVEATDSGDRWDVAGDGSPAAVTGTLAAVTGYLAGRGSEGVLGVARSVPELPAWL